MKLKSRLTRALAFISIVVFASFSRFSRKSYAMELTSQPVPAQFRPKEQEQEQDTSSSKKLVRVTLIPMEMVRVTMTPTETPETDLETIPVFSVPPQDLAGILLGNVSMPTQPPAAARHSDASAKSLLSRRATPTSGQIGQLQKTGSTPSTPSTPKTSVQGSVRSGFLSGSSSTRLLRDFDELNRRSFVCCGCEITAKKKQFEFDIPTPTRKGKEWNKAVVEGVKSIHKPQRLATNLYNNPKEIFSSSNTETNPLCVFAHEDRDRVLNHVQKLANSEAGSSTTTTYDPTKIIFEDTIPKGQYIKAFTFIDNYTEKTDLARDNKKYKLYAMALKDEEGQVFFEGLVYPETSPQHLSTGHPLSSTHADVYMRKGKGGPV